MYLRHFALTRLPFETPPTPTSCSNRTPDAKPKRGSITSSNSSSSSTVRKLNLL